ncbi:MAG: hypothetical protein FJ276_07210 [Planctomycetes bacterium]|nr:hypothetical protein [Planctomycetota bacterium]
MKRALLLLAFACLASIGCQHHRNLNGCQSCPPSGRGQYASRADRVPQIPCREPQMTGPATATYAYPYYTTRAPRDFLLDNPQSIGY